MINRKKKKTEERKTVATFAPYLQRDTTTKQEGGRTDDDA